MEPTFTHICHHGRNDMGGECPACLQNGIRELQLESPEAQTSGAIGDYALELTRQNAEVQEKAVREELLRTWLLTPSGPSIVRAILGGSESGRRIYRDIAKEAKRYE